MIINKLIIYSFKEKKVKETYEFNRKGINIILGERKEKGQETNGVGKSTMVDVINFILGMQCPKELKNSKSLIENDIFVTLNIEMRDKNVFIGRYFLKPDQGYILENKFVTWELSNWWIENEEKYKSYINNFVFDLKSNEPNFTSLREYIIRDEKVGFTDIGLPRRTPAEESKNLSYLFNIPANFEAEIKIIKNNLKLVNDKLKVINSLKDEIVELKAKQKDILNKMKNRDKDIQNLEIATSLKESSKKYKEYRKVYNKIQNEIFELEYVKRQYQINIEDLEEKLEEIKKLNDIELFYEQLLGYFPKEILKNQDEVKRFYEFMVGDRGKYFKYKIDKAEIQIKELKLKLKEVDGYIKHYSSVFKQTDLLKDINKINEEKNLLYKQLDEVRGKISLYEEKSKTQAKINSLKQDILKEIQKKQEIFNNNLREIKKISEIFNELVNEVYNEEGLLEFEINTGTKMNEATGRIKITCKIEDEESHGRHYMKVNMFDLTWLLYRVKNDLNNIMFLIHDGSYSKPDKFPKVKLLEYVDKQLLKEGKGQYFVTINIDEIDQKDLLRFDENKKIVAKFRRGNDDRHRFLGIKVNNKGK